MLHLHNESKSSQTRYLLIAGDKEIKSWLVLDLSVLFIIIYVDLWMMGNYAGSINNIVRMHVICDMS